MKKNLIKLLLISVLLLGATIESIAAQADNLLTSLLWHPGGQYLAGVRFDYTAQTAQVEILDRQYTTLWQMPIPSDRQLWGYSWNLDGTQLAFITQEFYDTIRIFIWDVDVTTAPITVQLRVEIQEDNRNPVYGWSPTDPYLLAVSRGSAVQFWDTQVGAASSILPSFSPLPSPYGVEMIAWHPSGQWIATHDSGDNLIITDVSVDPPQTVASWTIPDRDPSGLEWSPDGQYLLISDGDQREGRNNIFILAWDDSTQTLEQERVLTNDTRVQWLQWRGHRLLTMSEDRAIDIWDTDTWQLESVIERANWPVEYQWNALALTPDGTELAYISPEGNHIVSLPIGTVACTFSPANSTDLLTAIADANGTPEPDTICLIDSATYTFTTAHIPLNALPAITSEITIIGNGATLSRQAGSPLFGFFEVNTGGSLTLDNLTLNGGDVGNDTGGALVNE
ncbi:MAG: WD40 repeat domain-containing protein, partial [Bacteroidetes bacterium]